MPLLGLPRGVGGLAGKGGDIKASRGGTIGAPERASGGFPRLIRAAFTFGGVSWRCTPTRLSASNIRRVQAVPAK